MPPKRRPRVKRKTCISDSDDDESDYDPREESPERKTRTSSTTTESTNKKQNASTAKPSRTVSPTRAGTDHKASPPQTHEEKDSGSEDEAGNAGEDSEGSIADPGNLFVKEAKEVERIMCHREIGEDTSELLVKWKNKSYIHLDWVRQDLFDKDRFGKAKIQRYFRNPVLHFDDIELFPFEYTEIDRIIAEKTVDGTLFYLVKWNGLMYSESTWEKESDVLKISPSKAQEFQYSNNMPSAKFLEEKPRPPPSKWKPAAESLTYRGGNRLRSYQLDGHNWLTFCWYNRRNSILADEMGLGKTAQTVSVIHHIYAVEKFWGPFLIIAPLSTIPHWKREFEGWTDMNVVVYHGDGGSRSLIRAHEWKFKSQKTKLHRFNVLITTFEMALKDSAILSPIAWRFLAVDEAHRLKNKNCRLINALRRFKFDHLLLLTGTPLQNNMEEMWTLLNFMEPQEFASIDDFMKKFGNIESPEQVEELHKILAPRLLRRVKNDVEKSLAPKEETIIEVELTSLQKSYYRAIYEKNFSILDNGSKMSSKPSLLNIAMQLRKCCNHPFLIKGVEESITDSSNGEEYFSQVIKASGKLALVDKLLPKLNEQGHKVLIFSQMVRMLDILESYLEHRGFNFERIDGSVAGAERQAAIDRFSRQGSDKFVFLLCTRAGGLGINLTAADTVIIYDSDWNPQNDLQAQARCHRIGQTKNVKIYRLVTRNTYETFMFETASKKLGLDHAILQKLKKDGDPISLADKKEISTVLRKGAYQAFLEDSEDVKYDEEDIDKILERTSKTIVSSEDALSGTGVLSKFSKASFVSDDAATLLDINVDDPEFWKKVIPQRAQQNPLLQDQPRKRKQVNRIMEMQSITASGDSEDSSAGSDAEEFEDPNDNKGWANSERHRLKHSLLLYGFGRWNLIKIKAMLERRTATEVAAYAETFIRKCCRVLGFDEEAKLNAIYIGERLEGTDQFSYEGDNSLNHQRFIQFVQRNARIIIHKLEIMAKIGNLVYSVLGEEIFSGKLESFSVPPISKQLPSPHWTSEEDKSLLVGTYIHGFGQYDRIREDTSLSWISYQKRVSQQQNPETSFQAREAPDKEGSNELKITRKGDADEPIELSPDSPVATTPLPTTVEEEVIEDEMENDEEEDVNGREIDAFGWPSRKILNCRIRQIIRAFEKRDLQKERIEKQLERTKQKEIQKQGKQKKRLEANAEWSKREKQDFYRTIVCHGVPRDPETGDEDWEFIRTKAKLTRKTTEQLRELFDLVKEQCQILEAKRLSQSAKSQTVKASCHVNTDSAVQTNQLMTGTDALGEDDQSLSTPPTTTTTTTTNNTTLDNESLIYSIAQSRRFYQRVQIFQIIRDKFFKLKNPTLNSKALKTSHLPAWWKFDIHDPAFLIGISKHGFGDWEAICRDSTLPFESIAREQLAKNSFNIKAESSSPTSEKESVSKKQGERGAILIEDENDDYANDKKSNNHVNRDDNENENEEDENELSNNEENEENELMMTDSAVKGLSGPLYMNVIEFPRDKNALRHLDNLVKAIGVAWNKGSRKTSNEEIDSTRSSRNGPKANKKSGNTKVGDHTSHGNKTKLSSSGPADHQVHSFDNKSRFNYGIKSELERDQDLRVEKRRKTPFADLLNPVDPDEGYSDGGEEDQENLTDERESIRLFHQSKRQKVSNQQQRPPRNAKKSRFPKTYVDVPRDASGRPIFPINLEKLKVYSLGEIKIDNDTFHNEKYIFPVGFKTSRLYRSFVNSGQNTTYFNEIIESPEDHEPLFRVTAADAMDSPFSGKSASAPWASIIKRIREVEFNEKPLNPVSGPDYFGLTNGTITKLIQEDPRTRLCTKYVLKDFVSREDSRRNRKATSGTLSFSDSTRMAMWVPPVRRRNPGQPNRPFAVDSASDETDDDDYIQNSSRLRENNFQFKNSEPLLHENHSGPSFSDPNKGNIRSIINLDDEDEYNTEPDSPSSPPPPKPSSTRPNMMSLNCITNP